jgi:hypothetical protein
MSWAATGLLTYLVGRPKNWQINIEHLATVKTDKRDATRSALNELRKYGYCNFYEVRDSKGRIIDTIYLVFEVPTESEFAEKYIQIGEGEKLFFKQVKDSNLKKNKSESPKVKTLSNQGFSPETDFPFPACPFPDNPTLIIKENNNKRNIINKHVTCNSDESHFGINPKGYPRKDKFEKFINENMKGIDYTKDIQDALKRHLKKETEEKVLSTILETYKTGLALGKNHSEIAVIIGKGNALRLQSKKQIETEYSKKIVTSPKRVVEKRETLGEKELSKDGLDKIYSDDELIAIIGKFAAYSRQVKYDHNYSVEQKKKIKNIQQNLNKLTSAELAKQFLEKNSITLEML